MRNIIYKGVILTMLFLLTGVMTSGCAEDTTVNKMTQIGATVSKMSIPNKGQCVKIKDGLWVENEGSVADIYGNDECKHISGNSGVLCNNLHMYLNESCWIAEDLYVIDGAYGTMELYHVDF